MNRLMALCYFVLSLFGVDIGHDTLVHRSRSAGVDTLHSRATVQAGVARFECMRSASGRCHYLVLADRCAKSTAGAPARRCTARPIERFVLADGDSRQISGLLDFQLCVDTRAPAADCRAAYRVAAR